MKNCHKVKKTKGFILLSCVLYSLVLYSLGLHLVSQSALLAIEVRLLNKKHKHLDGEKILFEPFHNKEKIHSVDLNHNSVEYFSRNCDILRRKDSNTVLIYRFDSKVQDFTLGVDESQRLGVPIYVLTQQSVFLLQDTFGAEQPWGQESFKILSDSIGDIYSYKGTVYAIKLDGEVCRIKKSTPNL